MAHINLQVQSADIYQCMTAKVVELLVEDCDIKESVSHVTDKSHLYTEEPVEFVEGKTMLWLSPNSVSYIEIN